MPEPVGVEGISQEVLYLGLVRPIMADAGVDLS